MVTCRSRGMNDLSLHVEKPRVTSSSVKKTALVLLSLAHSAAAELIARFETDKGNIDVVLQYETAPQAVANLITLSQGTRARLDPASGAPTFKPLYVGEKFFRIGNNDFSKFAQTGSGSGTNSGITGFTFKDEFTPTLKHEGYTLSMANSGPNTNSGQIFFTGNISIPSYDPRHPIVGLVLDAESRAIVDEIINAGENNSMINAVGIERTDQSAIDFDEHSQGLPNLYKPEGKLFVTKNEFTRFNLLPAATTGDVVRAFRSTNLVDWEAASETHVGISTGAIAVPALTDITLDDAGSDSAFYNITVASHPGAVAPSTLQSRSLEITLGQNSYRFDFDNSGTGGTVTCTPAGEETVSGTFSVFDFTSSAHNFLVITDSLSIASASIPRYLQIRFGADTATNSLVSGHQLSFFWVGRWAEYPPGSATITRQ
jgi:cyclophilin family peptidyl-prolyl cis-trans isomerase